VENNNNNTNNNNNKLQLKKETFFIREKGINEAKEGKNKNNRWVFAQTFCWQFLEVYSPFCYFFLKQNKIFDMEAKKSYFLPLSLSCVLVCVCLSQLAASRLANPRFPYRQLPSKIPPTTHSTLFFHARLNL